MLICDRCHKEIIKESYYGVVHEDISEDYIINIYERIGDYHLKCFQKLFIFRYEDEEKRGKCCCGETTEYNEDKISIYMFETRDNIASDTRFHIECFKKYWNGKPI